MTARQIGNRVKDIAKKSSFLWSELFLLVLVGFVGGKTGLALEIGYIMICRQESRHLRGVGYEGIDQYRLHI